MTLDDPEHVDLEDGDLEPCVDCGQLTTGRDQGGSEGVVPRCSSCTTYDLVEDAVDDAGDEGLARWSS